MLKALKHQATVSSIIAKVDGSVGYRINTPELTTEEKSAIFEMQNQNVEVLVSPLGAKHVLNVNTDINTKSQSQRIRNVLYILYQQNSEGTSSFDEYYKKTTEKYIEYLKGKIEQ